MTALLVLKHSFDLSNQLHDPDPVKQKKAKQLIKSLPQEERRTLLGLIGEFGVAIAQGKALDPAKKYQELDDYLTGKTETARTQHILAKISRARKNRIVMPWESDKRISSNQIWNAILTSKNSCFINDRDDFETMKKKLAVTPLDKDILDAGLRPRLPFFQRNSLDNPNIVRDWIKQMKGRPDYTKEIHDLLKDYDKQVRLSFPGNFEQNKKKLAKMRLTTEVLETFLISNPAHEGNRDAFVEFFDALKTRKDYTSKIAQFLDQQFEKSMQEGTLEQKMNRLLTAPLTNESFALFRRGAAKQLAAMAFDNPLAWMRFSHQVNKHKDCTKKIRRHLEQLDRWLTEKKGVVPHPFINEIQGQIISKANLPLDKVLAFLGDEKVKSGLSLFKRIDVKIFANWVNANSISLLDLGLNQEEWDLMVPYLKVIHAGSAKPHLQQIELFAHPEAMKGVEVLEFDNFQPLDRNKTLEAIKTFKGLTHLCLMPNPWGGDLSYLTSFPELESLWISQTLVDLNQIKMIAGFTKLKELFLYLNPDIRDYDLGDLKPLRLEFLGLMGMDFSGAVFSDDAFKPFLESLELLSLNDCVLYDISISDISVCSKLRGLHLARTRITSETLAILCRLPLLNSLNISGCHRIDPNGFRHLKWIKNLGSLSVADYPNIHVVFYYLLELEQLTHLDLDHNPELTDALILQLGALRNLQFLSLADCRNVTDAGINGLKALIPNLIIER